MNVTIVRHAHVSPHHVPVHLNFILRSDKNMVPFVIRLPYALILFGAYAFGMSSRAEHSS